MKGTSFTAVVRKGPLEYVAVALEYNVAARGRALSEVKKNLVEAVDALLSNAEEDVAMEPISTEEFIGFLRETTAVPSGSRARDESGIPLQVFCYA